MEMLWLIPFLVIGIIFQCLQDLELMPKSERDALAWQERNLFWGAASFCLTFILTALGFGMSGNVILAHWLFAAALPCGSIASWCICRQFFRNKVAPTVASSALLAIAVFAMDVVATGQSRPHIHVIAVDLQRAVPGATLASRVHFQNDGNQEINRLGNFEALAIMPYSSNREEQLKTEDGIFRRMEDRLKTEPIPENRIPAHSIELNSDQEGTSLVIDSMLKRVEKGEYAVYLTGRIRYKNNDVVRHSDYCYFTTGIVRGMKLCGIHNEEP